MIIGIGVGVGFQNVSLNKLKKFLFMDGVNASIQTPSISFTEVIMDISVEFKTGVDQIYLDARTGAPTGYILRRSDNTDQFGGSFSNVYIDGVAKSPFTAWVSSNQRVLMRANSGSVLTDDVTIFRSGTNNVSYTKGKIYSVKFYNGGSLVTHYDMSTGTVQDQSGNGNHATLTGGTWAEG